MIVKKNLRPCDIIIMVLKQGGYVANDAYMYSIKYLPSGHVSSGLMLFAVDVS